MKRAAELILFFSGVISIGLGQFFAGAVGLFGWWLIWRSP